VARGPGARAGPAPALAQPPLEQPVCLLDVELGPGVSGRERWAGGRRPGLRGLTPPDTDRNGTVLGTGGAGTVPCSSVWSTAAKARPSIRTWSTTATHRRRLPLERFGPPHAVGGQPPEWTQARTQTWPAQLEPYRGLGNPTSHLCPNASSPRRQLILVDHPRP